MALHGWKRNSPDNHLEEERKTMKDVIMIELTIKNKNFRHEDTYAADEMGYLTEDFELNPHYYITIP
jgi:hypothetical protein